MTCIYFFSVPLVLTKSVGVKIDFATLLGNHPQLMLHKKELKKAYVTEVLIAKGEFKEKENQPFKSITADFDSFLVRKLPTKSFSRVSNLL